MGVLESQDGLSDYLILISGFFDSGDLIGSYRPAERFMYRSERCAHPLTHPLTATISIIKMPVCQQ